MPYIDQLNRRALDGAIDRLVRDIHLGAPGQLNYVIYRLMLGLWQQDPRYSTLNMMAGALECARLEFYRRVAVPYEERKLGENGDVEV